MEPIVDQMVLGWIGRLVKQCAANSQASLDIGQKIQFLTIDIITKLCLGDEIGCVKNDSDVGCVLEVVKTGNWACQYFSVFLELNTLLFQLAKIPLLRKSLFPKPHDATGIGRLMGVSHFMSVLFEKNIAHFKILESPRCGGKAY